MWSTVFTRAEHVSFNTQPLSNPRDPSKTDVGPKAIIVESVNAFVRCSTEEEQMTACLSAVTQQQRQRNTADPYHEL